MFFIFLLIAIGIGLVGTYMLTSTDDIDKNTAPARAYAMNMMEWHQAAMLAAMDDMDPATTNVFDKISCKTEKYGGSGGWTDNCALQFSYNGNQDVMNKAREINPGYQKIENWRSYFYSVNVNESYIITLLPQTLAARNDPTNKNNFLVSEYVIKGLREDMGYDRSGVGIIRRGCTGASVPTDCAAQLEPIVADAGNFDNPMYIVEVRSHQPVPRDFNPDPTNNVTWNAPAIMTRIQ